MAINDLLGIGSFDDTNSGIFRISREILRPFQ